MHLVDKLAFQPVEEDVHLAKDLGLIRVEVWRVHTTRISESSKRGNNKESPNFTVAEKALKGKTLSHRTS